MFKNEISEAFMAVDMKNSVFWDMGRVDIALIDVSEERIASHFSVEKSASEEPA
jgi:hypothetical protein